MVCHQASPSVRCLLVIWSSAGWLVVMALAWCSCMWNSAAGGGGPCILRVAQGIVNLIKTLQKRGVAVYMISGGFREDIMPIAKYLGVPKENVFANRMNWWVLWWCCVC